MGDGQNRSSDEFLLQELEQFKRDQEKVKTFVGQIGGVKSVKRDRIINLVFITAIAALFLVDLARHLLQITIPLPPMVSLELGILLVSIKIVWMIHRQTKVEHFQFWILHTIEFRLNEVGKNLRQVKDRVKSRR